MKERRQVNRRELLACVPGLGALLGLSNDEHEKRIDCLENDVLVHTYILKGHEHRIRRIESRIGPPATGDIQEGDM